MSKRRKAGEWVWLEPNSGFVGESDRYKAEIQPEEEPYSDYPCMLDCGDRECREWATLLTAPVDGKRFELYHVSECQMRDEPVKH
jgi:hypothetical protein